MSRASYGKRLSFEKHELQDGRTILQSRKYFTNADATKMVRLQICTETMTFSIVDAVTGASYDDGGGVTNEEVLFRKAKRHLKKLLDVYFEPEIRKKKSESNG